MGAESIRVMHPLFQAGEGGSIPTSALLLEVSEVPFGLAKALNRRWHSRLPKLGSMAARVCYAAEFDGVTYAVAVWSQPSHFQLPQREWLQLQRFAVAPDAPKNTASRLLAVMARLIPKKFPEVVRLITYQDPAVHTGTIYKAAGWTNTGKRKSGGFASAKVRYRKADQAPGDKVRWEKQL